MRIIYANSHDPDQARQKWARKEKSIIRVRMDRKIHPSANIVMPNSDPRGVVCLSHPQTHNGLLYAYLQCQMHIARELDATTTDLMQIFL